MKTVMLKLRPWLLAVAVIAGCIGAAQAESLCQAQTTAKPPAEAETVTCSQAAISRYFLISPTLSALTAEQRAAVIGEPLHYAFAYMTADAVNRLQQGFADKAVTSLDYRAILTASDAKGIAVPHPMFEIRLDRAAAEKIDWKKLQLQPTDLFKQAPSQLSHWLLAGMAAEAAKQK